MRMFLKVGLVSQFRLGRERFRGHAFKFTVNVMCVRFHDVLDMVMISGSFEALKRLL